MRKLAFITRGIFLVVLLGAAGCGNSGAVKHETSPQTKKWRLDETRDDAVFKGLSLVAKLGPESVRPDGPAMLEVRIASERSDKPYRGKLWYRFAYRRGDPLPAESDFAVAPTYEQEDGVTPRFDDFFEWAEIVEPQIDVKGAIFETPVMLAEGKAYVQFRIEGDPNKPPLELVDWFVHVNKSL